MDFQKAKREQVWTKLLLAGPSGSGKTYTALRLAKGIANIPLYLFQLLRR